MYYHPAAQTNYRNASKPQPRASNLKHIPFQPRRPLSHPLYYYPHYHEPVGIPISREEQSRCLCAISPSPLVMQPTPDHRTRYAKTRLATTSGTLTSSCITAKLRHLELMLDILSMRSSRSYRELPAHHYSPISPPPRITALLVYI
jgi:hypothetical protein